MDILLILKEVNEYHTGIHVVYASEEHGEVYINLRFLNKPEHRDRLKEVSLTLLEEVIQSAGLDTKKRITVVGPETLGAVLAEVGCTEYRLKHPKTEIRAMRLQAVKEGDNKTYVLESEQMATLLRDSQVIYLDDVMTTSSTLIRCRPLIEEYAPIAAIGMVVDRSGLTATELKVPHYVYLARVPAESFLEEDCPFCKALRPVVTNLGHVKAWKDKNPFYAGGFVTV